MVKEGVRINGPVWVFDGAIKDPTECCFAHGTVVSIESPNVVVKTKKGNITSDEQFVYPANPDSKEGVADNTSLMHLYEPNILENLRSRFQSDLIYTYTAHILIALNPFKKLSVYSEDDVHRYRGKYIGTLPPHVFAIADRAYRSMCSDLKCQSVIVSGESGAGKTETSKILMRYLLAVSGRGDGGNLEKRILDTNPILEAFGNAKTLRNNNSSRFGKYMKINFDYVERVCGASIVTYLLEKSRVVFQAKNERNYHVLYQLCAGASPKEREEWKLLPTSQYAYLNQSGCDSVPGIDDAAEYAVVKSAMSMVGLDESAQSDIFRTLAGILYLGNILFEEGERDNALVKNEEVLSKTSSLLGFSNYSLQSAITVRSVTSGRGSMYTVPLKPTEAVHTRNALAKALYGRIFLYLVRIINSSLMTGDDADKYIGILDIFGFEFFEVNSFEQLCINMANEKLQQHFIQNVFKQEQEIYEREAIKFPNVQYRDNQPCLDVLETKGTGIFAILDEECKLPKGTDRAFTGKVHISHEQSACCRKPKMGRNCKLTETEAFVIRHFAGEVTYVTEDFLDKNNDALHNDVEGCIRSSSIELVSSLGEEKKDTKGGRRKLQSVGGQFLAQLQSLRGDLDATVPNYIRCIKSNSLLKPNVFHSNSVAAQLRESGMLEVVQLMHAGFPTRCAYSSLHERYNELMPPALQQMSEKDFCGAILEALEIPKGEYELGLTRVFFRAGKLSFLEALRGSTLPKEVADKVRRWLVKKRFRKAYAYVYCGLKVLHRLRLMRAGVRFARAAFFLAVYLKTFYPLAQKVKRKRAAITVTKVIHGHFHRTRFLRVCRAVHTCQKQARMVVQRRRFLRLQEARRRDKLLAEKEAARMREVQAEKARKQAIEEAERLKSELAAQQKRQAEEERLAKQRREEAEEEARRQREAEAAQLKADLERQKEELRKMMEEARQARTDPAHASAAEGTALVSGLSEDRIREMISEATEAMRADVVREVVATFGTKTRTDAGANGVDAPEGAMNGDSVAAANSPRVVDEVRIMIEGLRQEMETSLSALRGETKLQVAAAQLPQREGDNTGSIANLLTETLEQHQATVENKLQNFRVEMNAYVLDSTKAASARSENVKNASNSNGNGVSSAEDFDSMRIWMQQQLDELRRELTSRVEKETSAGLDSLREEMRLQVAAVQAGSAPGDSGESSLVNLLMSALDKQRVATDDRMDTLRKDLLAEFNIALESHREEMLKHQAVVSTRMLTTEEKTEGESQPLIDYVSAALEKHSRATDEKLQLLEEQMRTVANNPVDGAGVYDEVIVEKIQELRADVEAKYADMEAKMSELKPNGNSEHLAKMMQSEIRSRSETLEEDLEQLRMEVERRFESLNNSVSRGVMAPRSPSSRTLRPSSPSKARLTSSSPPVPAEAPSTGVLASPKGVGSPRVDRSLLRAAAAREEEEERLKNAPPPEALVLLKREKDICLHVVSDSLAEIAEGVPMARLSNAVENLMRVAGPVEHKGDVIERPWSTFDAVERKLIIELTAVDLTSAIAKVLLHGFKSFRLFGSYHVWDFIESMQVGSTLACVRPVDCVDTTILRMKKTCEYVNRLSKDNNTRLRAWVNAAVNEKQLHLWMRALSKDRVLTSKFYEPTSLICSEDIRDQTLRTLEKLVVLQLTLPLIPPLSDKVPAITYG